MQSTLGMTEGILTIVGIVIMIMFNLVISITSKSLTGKFKSPVRKVVLIVCGVLGVFLSLRLVTSLMSVPVGLVFPSLPLGINIAVINAIFFLTNKEAMAFTKVKVNSWLESMKVCRLGRKDGVVVSGKVVGARDGNKDNIKDGKVEEMEFEDVDLADVNCSWNQLVTI